MQIPIQLIVGLGNPGKEYENTRHNAGAWFVEQLAKEYSVQLKPEKKFHSLFAKIKLFNQECFLLIPSTYMNESGTAVAITANFFKIPSEGILVAHDDLDLPLGIAKLKQGGGHGGHNGLRDIIEKLGSNNFVRARFGINHPGDKNKVVNYVLGKATKDEKTKITQAINNLINVLPELISGELQSAMQILHTGE